MNNGGDGRGILVEVSCMSVRGTSKGWGAGKTDTREARLMSRGTVVYNGGGSRGFLVEVSWIDQRALVTLSSCNSPWIERDALPLMNVQRVQHRHLVGCGDTAEAFRMLTNDRVALQDIWV